MPPVRIELLSCSTSLRDLLSAVAGLPSSSSTSTSILWPATWPPISARYSWLPFTMSLPIWAKGPVRGARKPILIGADCAGATTGAKKASSAAQLTRRKRVMRVSPCRLSLRPERAQHAARREQDDADVHGAEDQEPALGVDADEVLEEHDGGRTEGGPRQRAGPAEGDHQQRFHGGDELHVDRADKAVVPGPEHAGESREGARDDERQVLVQPHVVAQCAHARLALANALEGEAEGRARDRAERRPRESRRQQREVEEWDGRRQIPRQRQRGTRHPGDAVVALGERDPAEGEAPHDHAQGERDHQKVRASRTDRDEAEERG